MDDLRKKSKSNALWRHCQLYHESKEVPFSMTVASTHKEPYARKCREGVLIIAEEQEIMLNSNSNSQYQEPERIWIDSDRKKYPSLD